MKIRGKISEGMRVAAKFTQVPWVRDQCIRKLSFDPFPGTLNLDIEDSGDLAILKDLKASKGVELVPENPSFCSAKCLPVLIAGRIKGAIIFPMIEDYPPNKLELIAPVHLKDYLSVRTNDLIEIEVLSP
ncbi:MAG: CTP-dependent riboflavin kinase [Deltaproteobacteria bacterium]|nr:CTP-dependent riboflavin kinase [Deltaproteobacteria bacterium]